MGAWPHDLSFNGGSSSGASCWSAVPGCFVGVAPFTQTRSTRVRRVVMTIILDTFLVPKKQYVMTSVTQEIISFGSAISACEKGGQWQLALHLLQRLSVRPAAYT